MIRQKVKYLLSFLKPTWGLQDYPIRYVHQKPDRMAEIGFRMDRWEKSSWRAQVEGWPLMFGLGESKQEARQQLESNFREFKEGGNPLPRPGTRVKMTFGEPEIDRIVHYDSLASHFMSHILKFEGGFWLSDRSSIWDFPVLDTPEELVRKIALRYSVDVADLIETGILVDIFERITRDGNPRLSP